MPIEYLTEVKSFRHQRKNALSVTTSGTLPDGTPNVVHTEAQPDAIQEMEDYLNDKGSNEWELIHLERLDSSSDKYQFLFVFKK